MYSIEEKKDAQRIFLLNIFAPGFGTVLAGLLASENYWKIVIIGHLQMLLTPVLLGWIWSIVIGIRFKEMHSSFEKTNKASNNNRAAKSGESQLDQ